MVLRSHRGGVLASYRYPEIEATFSSPMHSWDNLHFVNGWQWFDDPNDKTETTWTREGSISRVSNRKKPIAFEIPLEQDQLARWQGQADAEGCAHHVLPNPGAPLGVTFGVAVPGKIGQLLDLDAVTHDYRAYLRALEFDPAAMEEIIRRLEGLRQRDLSSFLDPNWHYASPQSNADCAQVGLLLGYPLESTIAFIDFGTLGA